MSAIVKYISTAADSVELFFHPDNRLVFQASWLNRLYILIKKNLICKIYRSRALKKFIFSIYP
ncbi:MAG: hypothetical protein DWQ44_06580 [Bacteroidetes bacterium]|nr:MAG: hypothetical protein DWQ33_03050 [Bacteroidota bacterium]REK00963.1 MAG: hypothetical protein DWQ39_10345 [Bacteroidota bacterium]REK34566.1 MAG: hypothetical protein DWQ44_06580 [Bacteroidota bacterium]REK51825.1 MAG: hypothetical protein DWQ48_00180 [Bacteroidota bacterium]